MASQACSATDGLSEGGTALADGVVLRRPGVRERDDVVGRRRGAVSAGAWYVRADNAIRMGGGVCTGGEAPWNAVWEPNTRVVRLAVARRIAGAGRVGVGGGEEGGGRVDMHTVQAAGGETVYG